MIFVKPFYNNFWDNLLCLSLLLKNKIGREKGRERVKTQCEYERELFKS